MHDYLAKEKYSGLMQVRRCGQKPAGRKQVYGERHALADEFP